VCGVRIRLGVDHEFLEEGLVGADVVVPDTGIGGAARRDRSTRFSSAMPSLEAGRPADGGDTVETVGSGADSEAWVPLLET